MRHFAGLLIFCLLIQPIAFAQNSKTNWATVQTIPAGQLIVAKTASGRSLKGQFRHATDSSLDLRVNDKDVALPSADISRVYVLRGRQFLKGTLIGAAVGTAGGAAIGAIAGRGSNFIFGQGACTALGAALGFISGSIVGLAVGSSHHKKKLVYQSS
jgi:hypothetical protein